MEVTRTSLSSYQGNNKSMPKQVRYAGAATKGKYGEELRENLSTLGQIRGKAPVIKADAVEAAVSDPNQYTKDAIKTALEKAALALQQGLGQDTSDPTDATISPTTSGGGGNKGFFSADDLGNLSYKNMPFVPQSQYKGVETDNLRYGDTMPDGAFGIGSKSTDDFSNLPQYQSSITKEEPRQTVAALPSDYKETEAKAFLDAAAYQAIKDAGTDKTFGGEDAQVNVGSGSLGTFGLGTYGKPAPSGDDLKAGSFSISEKGKEQALQNKIEAGIKSTGIPSGDALKPGSFGISSIERDTPKQVTVKDAPKSTTTTFGGMIDTKSFLNKMKAKQDAPKQTVASLPSNYKETESKAFAQAKSYQDSKAKGEAAAKATNTPTKPPAGSFGISEAGKKEAEANKKAAADAKAAAEAKKAAEAKAAADAKKAAEAKAAADAKAKADAKAAADSKAKQAEAKKKAEAAKKQQQSSSTSKSGRKSNTGSKKSSRGGKSSGGGSKGGGGGTSKKSNTGSKKASRGAKGGGTSKGGSFGGKRRRSNTKKSRRRCDIRCKFDISVLTNLDLIRDDLAHVAYFVKELQEE